MYLAQISTSETQAPFYINILKNILVNNNIEDKKEIDFAIEEAKAIADGHKDIFSINNDYYFLVSTLLTRYKDKLRLLKSNNYNQSIYSDIIEILK